MPELPEVETTKKGIAPYLEDHQITRIIVRQPQLRWPVPEQISALRNANVLRVSRRAKYLIIETDKGDVLVHLGMSGALRVLPQGVAHEKHDHVDVHLSSGMLLRYTDPRRFGAWLWSDAGVAHPRLKHLGPEPLTDDFTSDLLYQRSRNRKQAVKNFIMDNRTVVGVGNIYAQEALFKAGIHPSRAAGRISAKRYQQLADAIKEVLFAAVQAGGTTLQDFTQADGKPGYFQQELSVYGRAGKPCVACGNALHKGQHGQRTTVYCSHCQR